MDNLVTNALRYGGPNVEVSAVREGAHVLVTVSDDGPGIPEELHATLFDAYAHGAASHGLGGSGLGLLIVRQLCEAMSGTIEYDRHGPHLASPRPSRRSPLRAWQLDPDAASGHAVAFWHTDENLAESLVAYVANGLAAGEAVLVAATPAHHQLLEDGLLAHRRRPRRRACVRAVPPARRRRAARPTCPGSGTSTPNGSTRSSARPCERVSSRWRGFRVFGEIVDLYWRSHDDHLALELEGCWNDLRSRVLFPLLCAYQLAPGESAGAICDCHDARGLGLTLRDALIAIPPDSDQGSPDQRRGWLERYGRFVH